MQIDEFHRQTGESCDTSLHNKGAQGCDGVLLLKQVAPDLSVHGAERIIQQVDLCILVHGSNRK